MLNEKQRKGLEVALARYRRGEKYTTIAGYAGTGKSFLTKIIVQSLGLDPEIDVCMATFTGKAAQVLIDRGNKNCMTLHKLLYKATRLPNGKFTYKPVSEIPYKLVIVDEVSMAPASLLEQLFKHHCHVIMLGDPFQLPVINKKDSHDYLEHPHIFLDEIMRQDADSGIITLSMLIREYQDYSTFDTKDATVFSKDKLNADMLLWADIILAATNKERISINNTVRRLIGKDGYIGEGDKLINLHNEWNILSDNKNPLTNGVIGYLTNIYESFVFIPEKIGVPNNKIDLVCGDFISETGENFGVVRIDKKCLISGEPTLSPRQKYLLGKDKLLKELIPLEMTYGYCVTGHKAQGSEWAKVVVVEEGFPYHPEEHARWAYTSCTRASQKLIFITK